MNKVWTWKNELPATYPDQIFYGKIQGGRAVLMSMAKLRELYPQRHTPLAACSALAQEISGLVAQGQFRTVPLRQMLGMTDRKARAVRPRAPGAASHLQHRAFQPP